MLNTSLIVSFISKLLANNFEINQQLFRERISEVKKCLSKTLTIIIIIIITVCSLKRKKVNVFVNIFIRFIHSEERQQQLRKSIK